MKHCPSTTFLRYKHPKEDCISEICKGACTYDVCSGRGGGGYPKSRCSKGGCVNLVLWFGPKCRQGGRGGQKFRKFCRRLMYMPPYSISVESFRHLTKLKSQVAAGHCGPLHLLLRSKSQVERKMIVTRAFQIAPRLVCRWRALDGERGFL